MSTRTLTPVPRYTGRTVLGLLNAVKRAIREEPKRVDMSLFCDTRSKSDGGPACGTVGCFAGWVAILGRRPNEIANPYDRPNAYSPRGTAVQLLGPNLKYSFSGYHPVYGSVSYDVFNAGSGDDCRYHVQGTPEYAEAVCARIDRFIDTNKRKLAQRLLPGRKRK